MATWTQGEETPCEPKSSGDNNVEENEDEEEEEIIPSLYSPLEDLPSLGDLLSQHAWLSAGVRWMKHPQTGIVWPAATVQSHAGIL
jgi:hypothetical protein